MSNYYKRGATPVKRNKEVDNTPKKMKTFYKLVLIALSTVCIWTMAILGFDYNILAIPALAGLTLIIGSVEKEYMLYYLIPMAIGLPLGASVFTGTVGMVTLLEALSLVIASMLLVNYRPYLWKRSVLLFDVPMWLTILYLGVTNETITNVLLLSILIKVIITTAVTIGMVTAVRALLTGEEIHKWIEQ